MNVPQWLNPSYYQNVPSEQVDWSYLAQQWIAMRGSGVNEPPPAPPPVPPIQDYSSVAGRTLSDNGPGVRADAPIWDVRQGPPPPPAIGSSAPRPVIPAFPHRRAGLLDPHTRPPHHQSYEYNHGMSNAPEGPPIMNDHNSSSWPESYPSDAGPHSVKDDLSHAYAPSIPDPFGIFDNSMDTHPKNFMHMGFPMSGQDMDYRKLSRHPMAMSKEQAVLLDAHRRKLPPWIRDGLEKMEREKQKQREKEEMERQAEEEEERQRAARKEIDSHNDDPSASKFDTSSDESEDGVSAASPLKLSSNRREPSDRSVSSVITANKREELADPVVKKRHSRFDSDEKSKTETKEEALMKLRRLLTEILMEVTDTEIEDVAANSLKQESQRHKQDKRAPAQPLLASSSSALAALSGLGSEDSDTEAPSDGEDEHSSGSEMNEDTPDVEKRPEELSRCSTAASVSKNIMSMSVPAGNVAAASDLEVLNVSSSSDLQVESEFLEHRPISRDRVQSRDSEDRPVDVSSSDKVNGGRTETANGSCSTTTAQAMDTHADSSPTRGEETSNIPRSYLNTSSATTKHRHDEHYRKRSNSRGRQRRHSSSSSGKDSRSSNSNKRHKHRSKRSQSCSSNDSETRTGKTSSRWHRRSRSTSRHRRRSKSRSPAARRVDRKRRSRSASAERRSSKKRERTERSRRHRSRSNSSTERDRKRAKHSRR